jgi:hypothetical protein
MRAVVLSSFALLAAFIGCSASPNTVFVTGSGDPGGVGGSGGSGAGAGVGGSFTVGTGTGAGGTTGCSAASQLVYVLSTDNEIWSFDPPSKKFTNLFTLDCNTPNDGNDWAPNSMAVDRDANAWVNYVGSFLDPFTLQSSDEAGLVFKVDIDKKTCAPSPTVTLPNDKWYRLGMGYSTDAVNGTSETLYVTGTGISGMANSPGLGKIDMSSKALVPAPGAFNGDAKLNGQSAELTGTGDARLFGFFTTSPVRVAQLDKGTAKILSDDAVNGVPTPLAWAFSFWGGAFYLYTSADGLSQSTVTRFDPTTHAVDGSYSLKAPMTIVGAGVSTCAPLKPPN